MHGSEFEYYKRFVLGEGQYLLLLNKVDYEGYTRKI